MLSNCFPHKWCEVADSWALWGFALLGFNVPFCAPRCWQAQWQWPAEQHGDTLGFRCKKHLGVLHPVGRALLRAGKGSQGWKSFPPRPPKHQQPPPVLPARQGLRLSTPLILRWNTRIYSSIPLSRLFHVSYYFLISLSNWKNSLSWWAFSVCCNLIFK